MSPDTQPTRTVRPVRRTGPNVQATERDREREKRNASRRAELADRARKAERTALLKLKLGKLQAVEDVRRAARRREGVALKAVYAQAALDDVTAVVETFKTVRDTAARAEAEAARTAAAEAEALRTLAVLTKELQSIEDQLAEAKKKKANAVETSPSA